MLWVVWTVVLVLFLLFDYVSWHGDFRPSICIVPFQFDTTIQISGPIFGQLVVLFDAPDQVINVLLLHVIHTKVINNKCEQYRSGGVFPKAWGLFAFVVTMRGQPFSEEFICKYSSLWYTPHCASAFQGRYTLCVHGARDCTAQWVWCKRRWDKNT